MATGVGRSRICLASINSPPSKTPCYMQRSRGYLLYKPSYSRICPKFRCHGNRGHSVVNLNDAIKQAVPENPTQNQKLRLYLAYNRSYDSLNFFFKFPIGAIVKFRLLSVLNIYSKQKFVWFCYMVIFISTFPFLEKITCLSCFFSLEITLLKQFKCKWCHLIIWASI